LLVCLVGVATLLQHYATATPLQHCNTRGYTATHADTLQHTHTQPLQHHCNTPRENLQERLSQRPSRFVHPSFTFITLCNTHPYTATHTNTLQHIWRHGHTRIHCNTHQYTATHTNTLQHIWRHGHTRIHCNTHQYTATHTDTLQHTRIHCAARTDTLQHHCNNTATRHLVKIFNTGSPGARHE